VIRIFEICTFFVSDNVRIVTCRRMVLSEQKMILSQNFALEIEGSLGRK